ncbi:MAG: anthranilate phosphoribosyltransferase [Candidatus Sumerlaeota bacterium]|nr:anthranilate phosphoribosyltransferase [Candidatus Sumerlaeota bacterium]
MIREAIHTLVSGGALTGEQAREVAIEILEGQATPAQIASFVTALRMRGETAEHIRAFASVMREKAARLTRPEGVVLDTCGTGGDGAGTFNISTATAFLAAGAGVVVAKHGNRAASSQCGSADVLEALGVKVDLGPEGAQRCLDEAGICFLFAPVHHAAMRHAAGPRQAIGIRTIFNLLGPLSNPAGATHQLIGVFDGSIAEIYAEALRGLGSERALIVHGDDGLDEFTTTSPTQVTELRDGRISTRRCQPSDFGLSTAKLEDLRGGDSARNRDILLAVLRGEAATPKMEIALLNAGAALYLAGRAETIQDGIALARDVIGAGAAMAKLEALKECSNRS